MNHTEIIDESMIIRLIFVNLAVWKSKNREINNDGFTAIGHNPFREVPCRL